jgi:hypothetical protein
MGGFESLTEDDVAELLRNVKEAAQTGRSRKNSGQFSLAGRRARKE